eukprot:7909338-Alexandrium_andersonii.AAC.1
MRASRRACSVTGGTCGSLGARGPLHGCAGVSTSRTRASRTRVLGDVRREWPPRSSWPLSPRSPG